METSLRSTNTRGDLGINLCLALPSTGLWKCGMCLLMLNVTFMTFNAIHLLKIKHFFWIDTFVYLNV